MRLATFHDAQTSEDRSAKLGRLNVEVDKGQLLLSTPHDGRLKFDHWSFGQLATKVGAPANYLRTLPVDLAAENLRSNLNKHQAVDASLYVKRENGALLRAITSPSYSRIFNHEVIKKVQDLPGTWTTPPAWACGEDTKGARIATEADCRGSTLVKPGDWITPAGLYLGSSDMFIFQIDPDTRISDGSSEGLSRGFFVRNSEVGAATFHLSTFLFRHICGNHMRLGRVWSANHSGQAHWRQRQGSCVPVDV
jgi:hypothetical protein